MYKTGVKSNVDGITHTVTDKIIKMLKSTMDNKVQTELAHSENANPQALVYKTNQCLPGADSYPVINYDLYRSVDGGVRCMMGTLDHSHRAPLFCSILI